MTGGPYRVGIDLLEIERLERALERTPRLAERLFTDAEREHVDLASLLAEQPRHDQPVAAVVALPDHDADRPGPRQLHACSRSAFATASLAQKRAARCMAGRPRPAA